jgi:hypothetical protein
VSAKIPTFPKVEEEAAERSVDGEIAALKAALNELVQPGPKITAEEPAAAAARPGGDGAIGRV